MLHYLTQRIDPARPTGTQIPTLLARADLTPGTLGGVGTAGPTERGMADVVRETGAYGRPVRDGALGVVPTGGGKAGVVKTFDDGMKDRRGRGSEYFSWTNRGYGRWTQQEKSPSNTMLSAVIEAFLVVEYLFSCLICIEGYVIQKLSTLINKW